jgi:hypothetical protein
MMRIAPRPAAGHSRNRRLAAAVRHFALALAIAGSAADAPAKAPAPAETPAPGGIVAAEDVLAALPDTLLGAAALRIPGSELVTYFPRAIGRDPMVGVIAGRETSISTLEVLRASARGAFHESGLRRVIREGSFTTPKWPGANSFFGEYETGTGFKQSWTLETGRERISVIATYFRKGDSQRVRAEVADKIFGGAVVTASKPTE